MLSKLTRRPFLGPLLSKFSPTRLLSVGPTDSSWSTDQVEYLDESGAVIVSGRGLARPVVPGLDARLLSDSAAAAKLVELARRWRPGPDLDTRLSLLPFSPSPRHLARAVSALADTPSSALAVLRWARRQPAYAPDAVPFSIILNRLAADGDLDAVRAVFDDVAPVPALAPAANLAVRLLAAAGRLEPSFHCFRQLSDAAAVEPETANSVVRVLLSKGLPYKAFEVFDSMAGPADAATGNLLVPALARSGRLDAALKLYNDLRSARVEIVAQTFASLTDSLGKSGRLELALRVFEEMQEDRHRPSAAVLAGLIESFLKAGKLDAASELWEKMKGMGFRPNFALYTAIVEANAKSGRLTAAATLFADMEKAGFLPSPATFAALIEAHAAGGDAAAALKLSNSMADAGMRPGPSTYLALLSALAGKKMADAAGQVLLEMKAAGLPAEIASGDVLMSFIRGGAAELGLQWLQFMAAAGVRANSFLLRQLFESCLRAGLYTAAKPLLEAYVGAAAKVDLVLYTSVLAHLVRCRKEEEETALMGILGATKHPAHSFLCSLFSSPERRRQPALALVREFFQGLDYELEGGAARYFVNVLLNYLVLMGQMNRARCVWKVAYEAKMFPKAIVFDQHIAWSLDVRGLSVGSAVAATAHTLHRFRKRMVYYGVVPRRIKLVAGPGLKAAVAAALAPLEPPFEVGKVVLRASGDAVVDWFKKPIVQQFLVNELPSKADLVLHRLDVLFPSSAPELRSSAAMAAVARRANSM